MEIAVASGKGGTGKTTVAVNLAACLAEKGLLTSYVDCDVEEPNGHLFLSPVIEDRKTVGLPTPTIDMSLCDGCGECGKFCRFKAIISMGGQVLTFPELCHGCGGCTLVCPQKAITEEERLVGVIEKGRAGRLNYVGGRLRVGEALSAFLVSRVRSSVPEAGLTIIDAPPGTSCPVIKAVEGVDTVLMVTEPTPFGLHDLTLAVGMVRKLGLSFGVLINRSDSGDRRTHDFCRREGIPILGEIPEDRLIAEAYSRGELIWDMDRYREIFEDLALKFTLPGASRSGDQVASIRPSGGGA